MISRGRCDASIKCGSEAPTVEAVYIFVLYVLIIWYNVCKAPLQLVSGIEKRQVPPWVHNKTPGNHMSYMMQVDISHAEQQLQSIERIHYTKHITTFEIDYKSENPENPWLQSLSTYQLTI